MFKKNSKVEKKSLKQKNVATHDSLLDLNL